MLLTKLRINIIQKLGRVQGCLIDQGSVPDPDPLVRGVDPDPDPDPLVRGVDPGPDPALDPDPSIMKQI